MTHGRIVTENQLDEWVRMNSQRAQGVIVELVYRLVAASSPKPKWRRFSLRDSIGQHGPDGDLDTDFADEPFVPEGRSFWEIGVGIHAGDKATRDYRELTDSTPEEVRRLSAFIFVTPLSGRRDWPYTWKEDGQAAWLKERRDKKEWRDVRVIDGTCLIDWMFRFPAVETWLAKEFGLAADQLEIPGQLWAELRNIGDPPPLIPEVFLANRGLACDKLKDMFSGSTTHLKLDTRFPDQVAHFVAAYVAAMDEDAKVDVEGRCLFISGVEGWRAATTLHDPHILVANFDLDEAGSPGTVLLEKARRAGHSVIVGGMPGGIPHPNRVSIPSPKIHQVHEALEKAGYNKQRALTLAQKSDGNLNSLLRCLHNLSLMPQWAQGTDAAELAIAELLGSWSDLFEGDRVVVEKLSGKVYGEWIGKIREIALHPGAPLIQHDGTWKVVARYEGWYALGPRLFDDHLDRFRECAVSVLRECDPKFELPPDKRFAASLYGKSRTLSPSLRTGLATSLALLGSHHKALESSSSGKAETTAILSVREILAEADWLLWASLNDVLPLLAEAAPGEFLDAVEFSLNSQPSPFDAVFAQEGNGITGSNYMTGLLWALETLAWDSAYLTRVVVLLGELAARDPGGNWGNRPANSLTTILLPWFPQTCAPVSKRKVAVQALLNEIPNVAWKLLLNLLPNSHQMSFGTRKPAWRELIPDDWSEGSTGLEHFEQAVAYTELAINAAKQDPTKLAPLIDKLGDLPSPVRDQIVAHLGSETVVSMTQEDRLLLWTKLVDLVSKHRKFADAQWAMKPELVNMIAIVAEGLAPSSPFYHHQRLFNGHDFNLYEENGNFEEQSKQLDNRRQEAIYEILSVGGIGAVLEFAKAVEAPWRAGSSLGVTSANNIDGDILPALLTTEAKSLAQFASGFVWGRFRARGWQWVDEIDTSQWKNSQKGQLLACLPFKAETWERSASLLGDDESSYWSRTSANPYESEGGLEVAIDRLVEYDRAYAAIGCLARMLHAKQALDVQQAVRVLQAVLRSPENIHMLDSHDIIEVIKGLQDNASTNPDDLSTIEWAFLPLLDRHRGASPKILEKRLAHDPAFFCEVIRIVFRPKEVERPVKEPTTEQVSIVENAYHLLRNWTTPPGQQEDGTYSGEALNAWLAEVKTICAKSGHLEIALSTIGHVLIFTPSDPDGLWLHHSAAVTLNAKDAGDMRDGFRTELFNSRGAFWSTGGRDERELAAKYRSRAEEVESRGYHRLANTLRELATSYERDAERQESTNPLDG